MEKLKDIALRALKTFIQSFVSLFVAGLAGVDFTGEALWDTLISLAISAGAAAVSAVWNGVISPLVEKLKGTSEDTDSDDAGDE